jgi:hypothetical protein
MRRLFAGLLVFATLLVGCKDSTAPETEEGNWTPTLGGNSTYVTATGRWIRTGNQVWVTGTMYVDQIGTGSSGEISGLPFKSVGGHEPSGNVGYYDNLNMNVTALYMTVRPNSTTLAFHAALGAGTKSPTVSPFRSGSLVYFSAQYEALHVIK